MKMISLPVVVALTLMSCSAGYSAVVWTNTAGGNWTDAASWSPNQVPGAGDDAVITNVGNYIVTLDTSPTVSSLMLGGSSGRQTLATAGYSLTLNNPSVVNHNGVLLWANAGAISGNLNVATNGVIIVTGYGYYEDLHGVLSNAGKIQLTNSTVLRFYGDTGGGQLINLPGGLVDIQDDSWISYVGYPSEELLNQGTVRKSGGSGVSPINPAFYNSGTLDVMSGTIQLSLGEGNGVFKAEAGATLNFAASYELEGVITGAGTNLLTSGSFTGTNGVISGGTLTWAGGIFASGSSLTIATNGVLLVTGYSIYHDLHGVLTNAGAIQLTNSTGLRCYGDTGGGQLINLPGALVDIQDDSGIFYVGYPSEAVVNQGTVRKSGGNGSSPINPAFYNSGTLDVQTGEVDVYTGEGSGLFKAKAGTTLNFLNNYTADSGAVFAGGGTDVISGGTFALNGVITSSNLVLAGGSLVGSNAVISSLWMWTGGTLYGTVMVPTNGLLLVTGYGVFHDLHGVLTNAGTIQLTNSTGLRCYGETGAGQLINLPGALVDIQDDSGIFYTGYPSEAVVNQGTVRKSGGSGSSPIYTVFYNSGTLDVMIGTVQLSLGEGSGVFKAEAGATLNFASNYELEGVITGAGTNLLTGGSLMGTNGVISGGTLTWIGGVIASGSTLTIATNGVLLVTGYGIYHDLHGVLTNAGAIQLTNSTGFRCHGDTGGGQLINLPGALVDIQDDSGIFYVSYPSEAVVNQGTVRKSGGSGTSPIYPAFSNSGTLDAQSGTISLPLANYDLTGGRLNFGLNSPTDFGQISLAGAAILTGTLSANLNNGYIAIRGNSFAVLNYGSQSGSFGTFILPAREVWSTNYGATVFTLTVLNSAPQLSAQTNRSINELTLLTVTNPAVDLDLPPDTLAYRLLSPPSGANVDANGVITWTPAQTQSPGTNTITTVVNDSGTPSMSATNSFTVVVKEVNVAPSLPVIALTNVNELTLLTVNNSATNFNIHSTITGYALVNPPTNMVINASGVLTWTPAQAQSPGTNVIITIATNSNPYDLINPRLTSTNQFTVVVKEVNMAPTLPTISTQIVNELTLLTVTNSAANFNVHSTITGYALVNPPTNMVLNASGIITWTPAQAQSPGTNTITIVVTNSNPYDLINPRLTSTNQFTVIVKEVNVAPSMPTISTQIVNELTLLTVTNSATNFNVHSTITGYTLVNPPSNMVINASGIITWTPAQAQSPGTNTITTVVTNSNAYDLVNPQLTATNSFTVIVKEVNVAPVLPVIPAQTVNALVLLTVTNSAIETNIHATVGYTLVNPPSNMVINASGVITWTPSRPQGPGTNLITTIVTNTDSFDPVNPHLSATNSFTVIVYAPTLAPIGNYTVNVGQTVSFTASATDNDPTRTLTYSLVVPPSGAGIGSSSGLFNWRLAAAQANTTNTVQVQVTDNSTPALTDTKSFTVTVNPLAAVVLTPTSYTNGQFKFQVSGTTGPDYIIAASTNLLGWNDIFTNLSPTMPFQFTNTVTTTNRFYRVRLSP